MSKHHVTFPDGSLRVAPRDGESFFLDMKHFVWDGLLDCWVDDRGKIWRPKEEQTQLTKNSSENTHGCECGVWRTESDKHSDYCKLYRRT